MLALLYCVAVYLQLEFQYFLVLIVIFDVKISSLLFLLISTRVEKKPGFFQKNQKTRSFWFKPGFFGLNQFFFQSHVCVFMNENSHVLEQ